MKNRHITVVFQDCYLCGDKGRAKAQILAKKGIILRKVGFSTAEGGDLIHEAVFKHQIRSMPFYVEGDKFAQTLEELLEKPTVKENLTAEVVKTPKKKRKTTKKVKESEDGSI